MRKILFAAFFAITGAVAFGAYAQSGLPKPMSEAELKAKGAHLLTGAELKQRLIGNTIYTTQLKEFGGLKGGGVAAQYFPDDHNRILQLGSKHVESIWWIDGNKFCVELKTRSGNLCTISWDLGHDTYGCLQPNGECIYLSRFVTGNPEHL